MTDTPAPSFETDIGPLIRALLTTRTLSPVCVIVTTTISPSRAVAAPSLPIVARQRPLFRLMQRWVDGEKPA